MDNSNNFDFDATMKHLNEADCGRCQNEMGAYYHVRGDLEKAIHWFRKAAKHPDLPIARHNLACNLYSSGNQTEAREWFEKAAQEEYPMSLFYLGRIYEMENDIRALGCWRKSAALGCEPAIAALSELGIINQAETERAT